ncbi:MAG: adenosylcobalamin-dependent ribonucleoside-diphosphate reductase [Chloroflexi bacterium]|nr:adenosylcobalamin-dependent ribonucleoside-diphosphate reductase [Chloroflexota bacterium]
MVDRLETRASVGMQNPKRKPISMTPNARTVLEKRYLRRGEDGKPIETPEEMFERVARTIAEPETRYGGDPSAITEQFYSLLTDLRFFPNSPTFTGAGTPLGQLAACFVLPISDDMGRDSSGIFSTLRAAALIQQTGGGNGFSFSHLRPRGDHVHASAGIATGPVGFLRVYDTAFGEIAQGGTRRGANMAVLRVDHPDILEFIHCKSVEGQISNFNVSVGVTDAFMRAVEDDTNFDLINPRDGKPVRAVRARSVFDEIVKFAHHNGEPGMLFLDAANRTNPVPHLYELEATNPCGEQYLGPYENCCLGSINLAQHVTRDNKIDWQKLRASTELSTRFLDNVVDANKYVPAVPELSDAASRARRIGLGIMGLGDLMYRLEVRYGSRAGEELAGQVMEFVRYHAMKTSIELARERGAFPAIAGSIYDPANLKWTPPQPIEPFTREWARPRLDWNEIVVGIKKHGIRNAAQTTIAPTGTIATVAGVESYGCEPVFALAYTRHMNDNGADHALDYFSPLFERALLDAGLDETMRQKILARVILNGSCQDSDLVPQKIRDTFVVASDITPTEHVRMQAALQAFVDNSLSKTINFPETATIEDVEHAYFLAWKLGCKGITVYVAGTREKVVLETKETAQKKSQQSHRDASQSTVSRQQFVVAQKKPRDHSLIGKTYKIATPLGTAYVTVNHNGDNEPFEVFCNIGKAGSDTAAVSEAIGRMISLALRLPSPLSPSERLKQVVEQLSEIGGGRALGLGPHRVRSLPDGIARVLAEELGNPLDVRADAEQIAPEEKLRATPIGDLCPECGHAALVNEEGCKKCYACGHSEC